LRRLFESDILEWGWHSHALLPTSTMDKKEINSAKLTGNFLFWICGVGGLLLLGFVLLGHFVLHIF
jgi:hypothetical protein